MTWWVEGHPEHEGFAAAVVRDGRNWRELGQRDRRVPAGMLMAACECGWRGPRRRTVRGAVWDRFLIVWPEEEDRERLRRRRREWDAQLIKDWRAHLAESLGLALED